MENVPLIIASLAVVAGIVGVLLGVRRNRAGMWFGIVAIVVPFVLYLLGVSGILVYPGFAITISLVSILLGAIAIPLSLRKQPV